MEPWHGLIEHYRDFLPVSDKTPVISLINDLDQKYPGLGERISEDGKLRRFVNIYVNEEDVRFMKNEETEVKDGDEISIVPAIAGGM